MLKQFDCHELTAEWLGLRRSSEKQIYVKGVVSLDYTYEYDSYLCGKVVVVLTNKPQDPREIWQYACQIGAVARVLAEEGGYFVWKTYIKLPGDLDPRELTRDELHDLWR